MKISGSGIKNTFYLLVFFLPPLVRISSGDPHYGDGFIQAFYNLLVGSVARLVGWVIIIESFIWVVKKVIKVVEKVRKAEK